MTIIKSLNGELVPMTSEEETKFLEQQQEAQIAIAERQQEIQAQKEAKASALAKLSALGLTEEEVQAIIK
jgi:hypothetical protein